LYELPEGASKKYWWIADEILRRGLCESNSERPSQTLGKILRDWRVHFYAEGGGYYRLADRSRSAVEYERMRRICPQHFTANSHGKSIEHRKDNGIASNSATTESTAKEELHPPTKKSRVVAKATEQFDVIDLADQLIPEQVPPSYEGEKKQIYVNAYERKQEARRLCIQAHGYRCRVCEMTFEQEFGDVGKGYINVHHISPLSTSGARDTHPVNDLCPVCPNCHAMLHRGESIVGRPYSIEELRELRRKANGAYQHSVAVKNAHECVSVLVAA
jgi:hypothetical protein